MPIFDNHVLLPQPEGASATPVPAHADATTPVNPGRLARVIRWLKKAAPYVLLGIVVPGGGVAALLLWSSRHGGSYGIALVRTLRTVAMLAVALALPGNL